MFDRDLRRCGLIRTVLIPLLAAAFAGCSSGTDQRNTANSSNKAVPDRGQEIVSQYQQRDAAPYRHDRVRFSVKGEDGKADATEIEVWRKQSGGTTSTLSVITKPAEDAGAGSLAIEENDQPAVQITYSRSRDEFRETDTGKMFFGGLTAQELLGEWGRYDYKLLGESDAAGHKVYEVEGKLKQGQKSVIGSMRVMFDSENYLPIEMHLFDAMGKELRTYSKSEVRTAAGHSYIARVEVDNPVYNSHTTIDVLSREYPDKLDDSLFTRDKLKSVAKK